MQQLKKLNYIETSPVGFYSLLIWDWYEVVLVPDC